MTVVQWCEPSLHLIKWRCNLIWELEKQWNDDFESKRTRFSGFYFYFFILCHSMNVISAACKIILLEFLAFCCLEPTFTNGATFTIMSISLIGNTRVCVSIVLKICNEIFKCIYLPL